MADQSGGPTPGPLRRGRTTYSTAAARSLKVKLRAAHDFDEGCELTADEVAVLWRYLTSQQRQRRA